MKKMLYAASEILKMNIPGLPTSKSSLLERAVREEWYSEEGTGQGGTKRLYEVPAKYLQGAADLNDAALGVVHNTECCCERSWSKWAAKVDFRDFTPVRYAPKLRAAGGGGTVNYLDEQEIRPLMFGKSFLEAIKLPAPHALCLRVKGESMEPTLRDGAIIMIDTRVKTPGEGIYVIRVDADLLVKRLQPLPGSILRVKSDHPVYDDFDINLRSLHDNEFEIIGKAVYLSTTL